MLKTLSIFDEEEIETKPRKTISSSPPLVKIPKVRVLPKHDPIEHQSEIDRLLSFTNNKMYKEESIHLERERILLFLLGAISRSGRNLVTIVEVTEQLLKNKPNLSVDQAIDFATEGESFQILQRFLKRPEAKTKIIRR